MATSSLTILSLLLNIGAKAYNIEDLIKTSSDIHFSHDADIAGTYLKFGPLN